MAFQKNKKRDSTRKTAERAIPGKDWPRGGGKKTYKKEASKNQIKVGRKEKAQRIKTETGFGLAEKRAPIL